MSARKLFKIFPADKGLQQALCDKLEISSILAQLLINRGIKTPQQAADFLASRLEQLLDPYALPDMPKAVTLVRQAAKNKDKVLLFSDYDVDGITSLALLKTTLDKMGLDTAHYLPHRIKEGYGLNKNILRIAKERKAKLLITADCGTNNPQQVKELEAHNIEVIVTDHHEPAEQSASVRASATLNPKLKNSTYPYRDLAGVGVVYKFCQALTAKPLYEDLDLVSLGTIADVVPLTGENRVIVKEGLERITQTKRIGLRALMQSSGIKDKEITPMFVSYILGPRLNASGRMDTAETSLNLLLSEKEEEAKELAGIIEKHNRQRQKIESKILDEAVDLVNKEVNFKEHTVIVLAQNDWHQGVLGIVASKLSDRFYRPVIVISQTPDLCKGSGRSIKNFHLFSALSECRELLENFGGHSHAVGLVIARKNIEHFKKKINHLAKEKLFFYDLIPSLEIDMEISFGDLNEDIIAQLEDLEPFGAGNPEPLFYTRNLKLKGEPQVLGRETLKFWVTDGDVTYQAIGFGMGGVKDVLVNADCFDLVYNPRIDNWQGEAGVLLEVKDISAR